MNKKIYTVILNYNNFDDTKECIDSLINNTINISNTIVVVDNASLDDSLEKLVDLYKEKCVYIKNDENLGYAGGNNIGIKYALDHGADYVCILNNDTVIPMDFFNPCIEYLEKNDNVAFVGPVIVDYYSGLVQSTGGNITYNKGEISTINNNMKLDFIQNNVHCDYIGGACMVFKAEIIQTVGFLPEIYFLFFEETEWCCRAKKLGFDNVCISNVYIRHKESASINKHGGLRSYLLERNRIVFLKRNSPNKIVCVEGILYLFFKYLCYGTFRDKEYFKYLTYMCDGLRNKVDNKTYPFIRIY